MKNFISVILVSLSATALANDLGSKALKLVPGGVIQTQKSDEVKVKTPNGTLVEIDFTKAGEFEDASGDLAEKDIFTPGEGYKSLEEVVAEIKKQGYQLKGDWSYDKDLLTSWHYELEAIQDGKEVELKIDAKTAKILSAEIDD